MIYLVPQLATFLAAIGKEMPLQTRALVWCSEAVMRWWPLLLLRAAGVAGGRPICPGAQRTAAAVA